MKRYNDILRSIMSGLLGCGLLFFLAGGCASTPEKNLALESARAAYKQAQTDQEIMKNAPITMHEAAVALKKAEEATDTRAKEHFAYIAGTMTKIAAEETEQKKAERGRERLSKEKDKIVLESREFELKRALSLAEARAQEAQRARMEAEAKALEIERAKGEAQALALQAEKARKEAEARAIAIEQAKSETEAKALEAEQLRMATEAKALELEQTKKEAEARALELEKARMEVEAKALEAEMSRAKTEVALSRKKQLESELAELKAKKTERGVVLTLGDILFAVNKDNLMPGAMLTVDKLSEFLKEYPERNVLIEGHTDSTGSETYNLGLSQRRADSAKSALMERGISSERITTRGYGQKFPVASNATSAGRQQNRRVEIIILDEGVSPEKMLR